MSPVYQADFQMAGMASDSPPPTARNYQIVIKYESYDEIYPGIENIRDKIKKTELFLDRISVTQNYMPQFPHLMFSKARPDFNYVNYGINR